MKEESRDHEDSLLVSYAAFFPTRVRESISEYRVQSQDQYCTARCDIETLK